MAAITQIRNRHSGGRAYYGKKVAEGKTHQSGAPAPQTPDQRRHLRPAQTFDSAMGVRTAASTGESLRDGIEGIRGQSGLHVRILAGVLTGPPGEELDEGMRL